VAKPLARLRHSQATKDKISASKLGRPRSEETKAKIRAARLGKKHSPETLAKITEKRRARANLTDEQIAEECRLRNRRSLTERDNLRTGQWKLDQLACIRIKNAALFADVKQSGGWMSKRKLRGTDPRVSDGYDHREDRIVWPLQK